MNAPREFEVDDVVTDRNGTLWTVLEVEDHKFYTSLDIRYVSDDGDVLYGGVDLDAAGKPDWKTFACVPELPTRMKERLQGSKPHVILLKVWRDNITLHESYTLQSWCGVWDFLPGVGSIGKIHHDWRTNTTRVNVRLDR